MKVIMQGKSKLRYLFVVFAILGLVIFGRHILLVQAQEQSGGSPTSTGDSRLKTLATSLESLGYGATDSGSWGDWGNYWNRIYSAAEAPFSDAVANGLTNGGNTDFPSNKGGIHDDNPLPTGSYAADWTVCGSSNNYCDTGDSTMETTHQARMDTNTGLIWSKRIDSSKNWFWANNCAQPGSAENPGACSSNGDPGCLCVKLTDPDKTGCEALGAGWRLPYQKELMMAYIDGSAQYLPDSAATHWSSTTYTTFTERAWYTHLSGGNTYYDTKSNTASVRCVR